MLTKLLLLTLLGVVNAQDFITRGSNTDPAWARIINAAQHVTAAETKEWTSLGVVAGYPITLDLSTAMRASVDILCHPDRSVTLVFQADDLVDTQFFKIPSDFFININYQCLVPSSNTSCQPQVDKFTYDSIVNAAPRLESAITQCTGNATQLITTTGSLLGSGALAGMAALWSSQAFPGSTVSCITFDSSWSHVKVDQAFVRIFGKAVDFARNAPKPASFYSGAQQISSAGARIPAPSCTTNSVLCKVQPFIELACLLYNPTLMAQQYPDIIVLASGFNRAAIMWFEPINTAVFIFANLENIYDSWLNPNINGYQEPVPFFSQRVLGMEPSLYGASAALFERNLGGIPTVYTQFAAGFSALQAASNRQFACTGLLQCFNALSARAEPTNVILVGHALGGAYATVGGPWAAIAFPQSTIQVATAGAPAVVANNLFYVMYNSLVGTPYSVVNGRDPVPRYPGCISSTQLGLQGGMYINNTLMEMQNADPFFSDFQGCSTNVPLKDQDCSLYLNSVRRVTTVRVDIGFDVPLGGVANLFNAPLVV